MDPLFTGYTLKRIEEEGCITAVDLPVKSERWHQARHEPHRIKTLSEDQQKVYQENVKPKEGGEYARVLPHGVNGLGKTEVYIHALATSLEKGRGGQALVPAIARTPQNVQRLDGQ